MKHASLDSVMDLGILNNRIWHLEAISSYPKYFKRNEWVPITSVIFSTFSLIEYMVPWTIICPIPS